jgi:hypothetical protein
VLRGLAEHAGRGDVLNHGSARLDVVVVVLLASKTGWIIGTIGNHWGRLKVIRRGTGQSGCAAEETGGVHTNC